jgi:hypothetical protein
MPIPGIIPTRPGDGTMSFHTDGYGTVGFPDPEEATTVRKTRSIVSVPTATSQAITDWRFLTQEGGLIGTQWSLSWPILYDGVYWDFYRIFTTQTADDVIIWSAGSRARTPGETYRVIMTSLEHQGRHRTSRLHFIGVTMILNIRSIEVPGAILSDWTTVWSSAVSPAVVME